jgi:hypothetical protein
MLTMPRSLDTSLGSTPRRSTRLPVSTSSPESSSTTFTSTTRPVSDGIWVGVCLTPPTTPSDVALPHTDKQPSSAS